MGVNNKQRRAAKQRKRQRQRHQQGEHQTRQTWDQAGPSAHELVQAQVLGAMYRVAGQKLDAAELRARAESLLRLTQPQPRELAETVLAAQLARLAGQVTRGGWTAADLEQLVARNAGERHVTLLRSVLDEHATIRLDTVDRLGSGLAVAGLLSRAPLLDEAAVARPDPRDRTAEHPKLAQVRALLAKAESTEFDEEAEALTAKAQELISRYALERLVAQHAGQHAGEGMDVRRIWLDPPYVRAKTSLVHEVASANRCQAAAADHLGFSLVVGGQADLDAVELLVTSLLVQADVAMLRQGRRTGGSGQSRTRSFRRSFLIAYAARIGERLREASTQAMADEGSGDLLPVLRDHEAQVADAFDAMVPHTTQRRTSISNGEGWAAGLAAADLARLDVNGKLTAQPG